MSISQAADVFAHYIEMALEKAGQQMSPDMRAELNDARLAFHEAAGDLERLASTARLEAARI